MSKYHNKKSYCLSCHIHDSRFEADYCNRLLAMRQSGEIRDYQIQQNFDLVVNGDLICRHVVDFIVIRKDGIKECHETKGFRTREWEIKRKLFKILNSTIPYIVISGRERKWETRNSRSKGVIGLFRKARKRKLALSRSQKSALIRQGM